MFFLGGEKQCITSKCFTLYITDEYLSFVYIFNNNDNIARLNSPIAQKQVKQNQEVCGLSRVEHVARCFIVVSRHIKPVSIYKINTC